MNTAIIELIAVKQHSGGFICKNLTVTCEGSSDKAKAAAWLAVHGGYPDFCFIEPDTLAPILLTCTVKHPSKVQRGAFIPSDYQSSTFTDLKATIDRYCRGGDVIGEVGGYIVARHAGNAGEVFINSGAFKRGTTFANNTIFKKA